MYTHTCIKPECAVQYETEDPDPYYCSEHEAAAKHLAKELDAKIGVSRGNRTEPSALEAFDAAPKDSRGFAIASESLLT